MYFRSYALEKNPKAIALYENCLQIIVTLLLLSKVRSKAFARIMQLVKAYFLVVLSLAL